MERRARIVIIGAGTAGLSAYKEASKFTSDILLIDKGPLGSTCARVGCMPSKQLIHIANQFYESRHLSKLGINEGAQLSVSLPDVLNYVRKVRDAFTGGVVDFIQSLGEQFLVGEAHFINAHTLKVGNQTIIADQIIIATGSSSYVPNDWEVGLSQVLTSETLFEQETLPSTMAVIGGGALGLEMGQALARLGIQLSLFHGNKWVGGLTDSAVNDIAVQVLGGELPIFLDEKVHVKYVSQEQRVVQVAGEEKKVGAVLVAVGRRPNVQNLGLETLGVELDELKIPKYDSTTLQVGDLPIFIVGDANKSRPLLHEAADEGSIAAFNAVHAKEGAGCFKRRTPIRIVFTQPNIAVVGQSMDALSQEEYVVGEVAYNDQGRAKIEDKNKGILHIYAHKKTGKLLGAECIAPEAEHLAHQLAWAIQQEMTVFEILQMPFYHPVIEESLRTALRNAVKKIEARPKPMELAMCDSEAIRSLS